MATELRLAKVQYQEGVASLTIDDLPPEAKGFYAEFTRDGWPDGVAFHAAVFYREDSQARWTPWFRCHFEGGESLGRDGRNVSGFGGSWPGEHDGSSNPMGRRLKQQAEVRIDLDVKQPIQTAITVTPMFAEPF